MRVIRQSLRGETEHSSQKTCERSGAASGSRPRWREPCVCRTRRGRGLRVDDVRRLHSVWIRRRAVCAHYRTAERPVRTRSGSRRFESIRWTNGSGRNDFARSGGGSCSDLAHKRVRSPCAWRCSSASDTGRSRGTSDSHLRPGSRRGPRRQAAGAKDVRRLQQGGRGIRSKFTHTTRAAGSSGSGNFNDSRPRTQPTNS